MERPRPACVPLNSMLDIIKEKGEHSRCLRNSGFERIFLTNIGQSIHHRYQLQSGHRGAPTDKVTEFQVLSIQKSLRSPLPDGAVQLSISDQLLHRNVQRFRGGLVFKAHRLFVSLNSRRESNKEEGAASLGRTAFRDMAESVPPIIAYTKLGRELP